MTTTDPLHVVAAGSRVEHWGQHGPECFACKLKTIRFGAMQPPTTSKKDRWGSDPVAQRIQELNGISIDTDEMNKRARALNPK
jgi:hypothetical protein